MDFVVDRAKWRCGGDGAEKVGRGKTALLNSSGFMCCLGQTCNQLGVPKAGLIKLGEPNEINVDRVKGKNMPDIFFYLETESDAEYDYYSEDLYNTDLADTAMEINDDEHYSLEERETKLIELFKRYGHTLEFINEPVITKR